MIENFYLRYLEEGEDHHDEDKPWGAVIGASILVQLVTFSGVFFAAGVACFARVGKQDSRGLWAFMHDKIIPAFASGALIATTVFLLIPEALILLQGGHAHDEHGEHAEDTHADGDLHHDEEEHNHDDEEGVVRMLMRRFLEEHEEESIEYVWKFGTFLMLGILIPIILSAIFPTAAAIQEDCEKCQDEDGKCKEGCCDKGGESVAVDTSSPEDAKQATKMSSADSVDKTTDEVVKIDDLDPVKASHGEKNLPLASSIILGDAFHNFADGIFLGNAFLLCSKDVGFTIAATTIYHEIAQEITDYALLTHHCGLKPVLALALNFLAGFSTLLGAVIIFSLDLSEETTGAILALSAGVYVYIAASECIPRFLANRKVRKDVLIFVLCFVIGAVPIGLVLLNHGHCEEHGEHEELGHKDE